MAENKGTVAFRKWQVWIAGITLAILILSQAMQVLAMFAGDRGSLVQRVTDLEYVTKDHEKRMRQTEDAVRQTLPMMSELRWNIMMYMDQNGYKYQPIVGD